MKAWAWLLVAGTALGCSVEDVTEKAPSPGAGVSGSGGTAGTSGCAGAGAAAGQGANAGASGSAGGGASGGAGGQAGAGGTAGSGGVGGNGGSGGLGGAAGQGGSAGGAVGFKLREGGIRSLASPASGATYRLREQAFEMMGRACSSSYCVSGGIAP
jgi:hypothetical protein